MKRCLKCGKESPDVSKFCGYCGSPLPQPLEAQAAPPPELSGERNAPRREAPGRPTQQNYIPPTEDMYPPPRPAARQGYVPPPQENGYYPPPRGESSQSRPPSRPRNAYPPPQPMRQPMPPTRGGDKSGQQRIIIIAAVALIFVFILLCLIAAFLNRDTISGMIDPAARETQIQNDIQIGLTQTAAVNVNIPATVQAQIALTQAASGGAQPPAAAISPQAPPAQQPIQELPPTQQPGASSPPAPGGAIDPADAAYVQTVKQSLQTYDQAMRKIEELVNALNTDANKANDAQWKTDFSSATSSVTQTSEALRKQTTPQKYADMQPDLLDIAKNLDEAVKYLTEFITTKDAAKLSQAQQARDLANAPLQRVQQKLSASGGG